MTRVMFFSIGTVSVQPLGLWVTFIGVFATISLNEGFSFSPSLAASTSISTEAGGVGPQTVR